MIGSFGGEEQGRQPEVRINEHQAVWGTYESVLHDILGMPIHHRVLEIESFQVGNSGGLYFLWEAKVAT